MSELDKISAVREDSMLLSSFLDWLEESGYAICEYKEVEEEHPAKLVFACTTAEIPDDLEPYFVERWTPKRKLHEQMLADFFDIDLDKVEDERRTLLEELRKQHAQEDQKEA